MVDYLPDPTRRFMALAGPDPDETQRAMATYASEAAFPIIGPAVGGLLAELAAMTDARRVFEFGSGFGYSASWFARGMGPAGEITLTEVDADELDLAREYLETAGYRPAFRYEHGDAVEVVDRYEGPFDIVLLDHQKQRYVEGFARVRDKLAPGGAIVADNIMRGPAAFEDVLARLDGEPAADEATAAVVDYLERLRDDPAFIAVVLPIGNGISLGVRRR